LETIILKLVYLINGIEKPSYSFFTNQFQILSSNNGIGSTIGMDTTNTNSMKPWTHYWWSFWCPSLLMEEIKGNQIECSKPNKPLDNIRMHIEWWNMLWQGEDEFKFFKKIVQFQYNVYNKQIKLFFQRYHIPLMLQGRYIQTKQQCLKDKWEVTHYMLFLIHCKLWR
jgi:hypothetical protein